MYVISLLVSFFKMELYYKSKDNKNILNLISYTCYTYKNKNFNVIYSKK